MRWLPPPAHVVEERRMSLLVSSASRTRCSRAGLTSTSSSAGWGRAFETFRATRSSALFSAIKIELARASSFPSGVLNLSRIDRRQVASRSDSEIESRDDALISWNFCPRGESRALSETLGSLLRMCSEKSRALATPSAFFVSHQAIAPPPKTMTVPMSIALCISATARACASFSAMSLALSWVELSRSRTGPFSRDFQKSLMYWYLPAPMA
mmetsp:Transcript_24636/g.53134  ORF Transcript_24636/g.53134 Transcript_24636/m.53134 type:complete len:212 (-) Transcript_24636:243-878(-)